MDEAIRETFAGGVFFLFGEHAQSEDDIKEEYRLSK